MSKNSYLVFNKEGKSHLWLTKPKFDQISRSKIITIICQSMEFHMPVIITYADKGTPFLIIGDIHFFNELDNYIKIVDKFEHTEAIAIESIVDIQYHENLD
ncbi:YolD-like family protein [Bacillus sp. UMB0728]|uniref:YolD-like family protein n=1 Tax=Bacillus sp. UMB0728 TaxID=2066052 RepID=UPI0015DFAADD|nr:YolD-like family protein [Bacillus sp. UMB0728]